MSSNSITNVAIIGAGGNIGKAFVTAILATGKHNVTAITRPGSTSKFPEGVKVVEVDYSSDDSIVNALKGQDFLSITLSVYADKGLHSKIVKAALKAEVPYIMPNVYGTDIRVRELKKNHPAWEESMKRVDELRELGAPAIILVCNFWYEWSLALGECWFGFTIKDRKVTFFDDGNTKFNTTTWDKCGKAVANLVSLPRSGAKPCADDYKKNALFISSFTITQRDILDSLHRVLGTTDKDWEIKYESVEKRHKDGFEEFKNGDFKGWAKSLYSSMFLPNSGALYDAKDNEILKLPQEDLDEATKRAVEMAESGWNPFPGTLQL